MFGVGVIQTLHLINFVFCTRLMPYIHEVTSSAEGGQTKLMELINAGLVEGRAGLSNFEQMCSKCSVEMVWQWWRIPSLWWGQLSILLFFSDETGNHTLGVLTRQIDVCWWPWNGLYAAVWKNLRSNKCKFYLKKTGLSLQSWLTSMAEQKKSNSNSFKFSLSMTNLYRVWMKIKNKEIRTQNTYIRSHSSFSNQSCTCKFKFPSRKLSANQKFQHNLYNHSTLYTHLNTLCTVLSTCVELYTTTADRSIVALQKVGRGQGIFSTLLVKTVFRHINPTSV